MVQVVVFDRLSTEVQMLEMLARDVAGRPAVDHQMVEWQRLIRSGHSRELVRVRMGIA